jgi:electron transfer flavoprotein beta subunit
MKIVVPVQLVPDLVEELVVDKNGKALDRDYLRWMLSEPDDHAIEQAVLLKEKSGAEVIVIAPDIECADDVLFTAAAKGADKLIKLTADYEGGFNVHAMARAFSPVVKELQPDLVLTGVQTHDGIDGSLSAQLAEQLGFPCVGYVSAVTLAGGKAVVRKDFPGGLKAELDVTLPAVLGVASAESAPRYVPISKVRLTMKTSKIDDKEAGDLDLRGGVQVSRIFQPETGVRATMISGKVQDIAAKLAAIIKEQGLI